MARQELPSFCGRMEHGYAVKTSTTASSRDVRDEQGYNLYLCRKRPPKSRFLDFDSHTLSSKRSSASAYDDPDEQHALAWSDTTAMLRHHTSSSGCQPFVQRFHEAHVVRCCNHRGIQSRHPGTATGIERDGLCEWLTSPDADVYRHAFDVEGKPHAL